MNDLRPHDRPGAGRTSADLLDAHMTSLRQTVLRELTKVVGSRRVAYVDYALHGNVGDLLILRGTMAFFEAAGIEVVAYQSAYDGKLGELAALPRDVTIVCHGGGNFGDLYPLHQNFRERIVRELRDHRIVVFPQSVHFGSIEALNQSAAMFRRHADFHLCVRDAASATVGDDFSEFVHLVPDTAHMLWDQFATAERGRGELRFFRLDKESALGGAKGTSVDWETMTGADDLATQAADIARAKWLGRRPTRFMSNLAFSMWERRVEAITSGAADYFARYETIETDRLHGMLLGLLVGRRVQYRDNAVRKLSRYAETWLTPLAGDWVRAAQAN